MPADIQIAFSDPLFFVMLLRTDGNFDRNQSLILDTTGSQTANSLQLAVEANRLGIVQRMSRPTGICLPNNTEYICKTLRTKHVRIV